MKRAIVWTGALLIAWSALPAAANVILTIQCTAGGLIATQEFPIQCTGGSSDWSLAAPCDISSASGVQLARITQLDFQSNAEPFVNLHFAVDAAASDTTFDITSAPVSFAPLTDGQAFASAGVTLTGDSNGAVLTGLFDGGKSYQAWYNGTRPSASLVAGFSTGPNQTDTHSDRWPDSGYGTISDTLGSIQSEFKFTLSALDQASGTSRFEVTPEPATISLLALCGLALMRRRK